LITCEGCKTTLDDYNPVNKTWRETHNGKIHDCPQKEKLIAALKEKRNNDHPIDPNVRYIEGLTRCKKCGAKYSLRLPYCPQCRKEFIKSLFKEK
jgi:hypothetical protein